MRLTDGYPKTLVMRAFFAFRKRKPVRISFEDDTRTVVVSDENGRPLDRKQLSGRVVVDDGTFRFGSNAYSLPYDQYDAATAFANYVNSAHVEVNVGAGVALANFAMEALMTPLTHHERFQYAVVNVGMFSSADRMAGVLATAGENGWELVTVYDKASNWLGGMEKGFMLLKRRVPEGESVSQWCSVLKN